MTTIRVSAVSFRADPVASFEDFAGHIDALVRQASTEKPDLLVFPELLTAALLGAFRETDFVEKFRRLPTFTESYVNLFRGLAREHGVSIAAGSHLIEAAGKLFNTGHLFTPEGEVCEQRKCHLVPIETAWATPGDSIQVFETRKAKVAIPICYDLEFPETCRLMTLKGADILLCPSATLDEQGYWRVRHCGHARCVENQVYVVHSSLVGSLDGIPLWGMSSILTPCDVGFPSRGTAAESSPNEEAIVTAELDLGRLYTVREQGSVRTLKDRRRDILSELWASENMGPR